MTFASKETSQESGDPINLYRFVYGTGAAFNYTDADEQINEPGENVDYSPLAITHDGIRSNGTLDHATLSVLVPADAGVTSLFLVWPPSREVSLVIRAGHVSETEFPVKWTGRVIGCSWQGGEATLSCQPISTSLARPGLRRRYSLSCPYVLYDVESCKAVEAAATSATTVSAITSTTITVPGGWHGANAAAKYNGGKVSWTNNVDGLTEIRRILSAMSTTIRVAGLIRGLSVTDAINVTLGCNRQESDCVDLHANLDNHGGMSFLPDDNPVGRNKFY